MFVPRGRIVGGSSARQRADLPARRAGGLRRLGGGGLSGLELRRAAAEPAPRRDRPRLPRPVPRQRRADPRAPVPAGGVAPGATGVPRRLPRCRLRRLPGPQRAAVDRVRPVAVQQHRRRPLERRHGLPGPGPRPPQPDHPAGQPGAASADRARTGGRSRATGAGSRRGRPADRVRRRDRRGRRRDRHPAPAAALRSRPRGSPARGRGAGRLRPARSRRQPARPHRRCRSPPAPRNPTGTTTRRRGCRPRCATRPPGRRCATT